MSEPFDIIKNKRDRDILPLKIKDKSQYYEDLNNIEDSWTGRVDAFIANTFMMEASKLLINSMELFEMGYFDCAFYSMRQSLELATTMVYLVDVDESHKKQKLKTWKNQGRFPMYKEMHDYLASRGNVYRDIKNKLCWYFDSLNSLSNKINKYVHKQGENTFYILRNRFLNADEEKNKKFIDEYEFCLQKCIGAVAVFRLTVDPFPILLKDKDMYNRTPDLLTSTYSDDFIERYIGADVIDAYKKSDLYNGTFNSIINEEERKPCVVDVIKDNYIDKEKIGQILEQKHLLSNSALIAVALASFSYKVAKIYTSGLSWYFTSTESNRNTFNMDSRTFKDLDQALVRHNVPYDQAYLTCFQFNGDNYYIEHNEVFTEQEIATMDLLKKSSSCVGDKV